MKKHWVIAITFIVALAATFSMGCQKQAKRTKTIAFLTLMSHPSLDALKDSCVKELRAAGYTDANTRYVFRNANGQINDASTIASSLRAESPDVVIAVTTPMAQAVAAAKLDCPVVFAAVTDPVGAGLVPSLQNGHGKITGTSDAWPYHEQLKLIREISPNARRLGILYNPGEAASQYGIKEIRKFSQEMGFSLVEGAVTNTNEIRSVADNLAPNVDALFLSSDNTVIGGMVGALKVAIDRKLPLYVGDSGTVEKGGLATVSVGYVELGNQTAKLAVRCLAGERDIPVFVGYGNEIFVNSEAAKRMDVSLPKSVTDRATKVFTAIKE